MLENLEKYKIEIENKLIGGALSVTNPECFNNQNN